MIIILFKMFCSTDIYTILFFILIIRIIFLLFAFLTGSWWVLIIIGGFMLGDIFIYSIVDPISR